MAMKETLLKLRSYIEVLLAGLDAVEMAEAPLPPPQPPPDPNALFIAARNMVLAGSGDKVELFGNMEQGPTVNSDTLRDLGLLKELADSMVVARDEVRTAALDYSTIAGAPLAAK